MLRKYIALSLLIVFIVTMASGCFDMGGGMFGQPQPTVPPEKEFSSVEELSAAVAAAKADAKAEDVENLKTLTNIYEFKALPEGAKLDKIKVSSVAVIVGYTFGETNKDSFDNQMQIVWYRSQDAKQFLGTIASNNTDYTSLSSNGIDYLYINPDIQLAVTSAPGSDPAAPTPTPKTTKYFQVTYWVQDGACFMAAMPQGLSKDDILKYSVGDKVDLK